MSAVIMGTKVLNIYVRNRGKLIKQKFFNIIFLFPSRIVSIPPYKVDNTTYWISFFFQPGVDYKQLLWLEVRFWIIHDHAHAAHGSLGKGTTPLGQFISKSSSWQILLNKKNSPLVTNAKISDRDKWRVKFQQTRQMQSIKQGQIYAIWESCN